MKITIIMSILELITNVVWQILKWLLQDKMPTLSAPVNTPGWHPLLD